MAILRPKKRAVQSVQSKASAAKAPNAHLKSKLKVVKSHTKRLAATKPLSTKHAFPDRSQGSASLPFKNSTTVAISPPAKKRVIKKGKSKGSSKSKVIVAKKAPLSVPSKKLLSKTAKKKKSVAKKQSLKHKKLAGASTQKVSVDGGTVIAKDIKKHALIVSSKFATSTLNLSSDKQSTNASSLNESVDSVVIENQSPTTHKEMIEKKVVVSSNKKGLFGWLWGILGK